VTHLADETGVLRLDAPGTWRPLEGKYAIAASGFIAGIKRTELYATIYAGTKEAHAAAKAWKDARSAEAPGVEFTNPRGDPLRWIVVEPAKNSLEYCRALEGAGMSAVVWARLTGEPGLNDADAFALLDAAKLEKAVATGAEAAKPTAESQPVKDRDFTLELSVPQAMVVEKEVDPPRARMSLRLKGRSARIPKRSSRSTRFPISTAPTPPAGGGSRPSGAAGRRTA